MYSHSKKYKNPQYNKFNQSKQWHAKTKKTQTKWVVICGFT